MTSPIAGGVDCDLHPAVPHLTSLLPYLNDYWRDQVTTRGMTDLVSQSYPTNSPISSRPDWRPAQGKPGESLAGHADAGARPLRRQPTASAIRSTACRWCSPRTWQDAFCRALNDWLVREWLDKDARLRGSIVIPMQSIEKSVAEIERCAEDKRFVQVLMLVMGDMPLGKRAYWPIYAAAERLGLAVGIHAGSAYHNPPTSVGWGSYHIEDYVAQAHGVPDPVDQPDRRGRVRAASEPENGDAGSPASPGCRPICGGCTSSGAACAWRRRGSIARRRKLCAATSASRCSRSMRRRIRQP